MISMTQRQEVHRRLARGDTYRQIAAALKIGLGSVSRIAGEAQSTSSQFEMIELAPPAVRDDGADVSDTAFPPPGDADPADTYGPWGALVAGYLRGHAPPDLPRQIYRELQLSAQRELAIRARNAGDWYREDEVVEIIEQWHSYCRDAFVRGDDGGTSEERMRGAIDHFNGWLDAFEAARESRT